MYVGGVIMGLLGIGATIGGAAAGAHYAKADSKAAGAAIGASAGIAVSLLASAFYAAAEADNTKQASAQVNAAKGMFAARVAGVGTPRLVAMGPITVPTRG